MTTAREWGWQISYPSCGPAKNSYLWDGLNEVTVLAYTPGICRVVVPTATRRASFFPPFPSPQPRQSRPSILAPPLLRFSLVLHTTTTIQVPICKFLGSCSQASSGVLTSQDPGYAAQSKRLASSLDSSHLKPHGYTCYFLTSRCTGRAALVCPTATVVADEPPYRPPELHSKSVIFQLILRRLYEQPG